MLSVRGLYRFFDSKLIATVKRILSLRALYQITLRLEDNGRDRGEWDGLR